MNQACANFDSMSGLATKPGIAYENKKQVAKYKFSKEKDCADKLMSTDAAVCYTYWPMKTGWDFNCFLQSTVDGAKTYDHETTCSGKKTPDALLQMRKSNEKVGMLVSEEKADSSEAMNQACANFDSMSGLATNPGIAYENKKQVAKYKFSKEKDCADKLMSTDAAVCYTYWPKKTSWDFNCFLQSTVDGAKTYDHETICSGKKTSPDAPAPDA